MALQIWLPLDGNLENQGLANIEITNNGTTIDNNGKIGKCYSFGANKYINLVNYAPIFLTYNTFSLSVWFKCTAQNTSHTGSALISSGNWNAAANLLNLALGNFSSDHYTKLLISGSGSWSNGYSYNFYLNTWYHVVLTSGNGAMRAYVNGQLIGDSYAAFKPGSLEQTWVCIGNGTYNHGFHFYGLMNDVRIYDHCLSIKEVKEISKGLILHYRLSKPMPNLLNGDSHLSSAWVGENATVSNNTDNSIKVVSSAANGRIYNNLSNVWTSGKKYTVSFEAKSDTAGTTIDASRSIAANNFTETFSLTTSWQHYTGIINCNATVAGGTLSIRINQSGRTVYLRFIKLEEGEKETGYIPPINSISYTTIGYNSNIEPDCSGYKRDGIIVGTITGNTDTPRYRTCNNITNNSSYIKIDNLQTSGFSNSYSFSWWGKISSFSGRMFWGFSNGIRLNGVYNGNLWNTGDSSNNPLYVPGTTTQITVPSVNIWHHFVMTGDGTNCKLYLDGKYYGIAKTYKGISGTTLIINGWDTGTSYSGQINISDFRIYCTALSADDIKALYEDAGYVDKNGNFHAYEFVEE